jgi:hypothetical protein
VNDETDLRKVIAYLHDLDAELKERSPVHDPRANSSARKDMLYQLDHAKKLIAVFERDASNIFCLSNHDGAEVLVNLPKARSWCHLVEAKIARLCGHASAAAAS